MAPDGTGIWRRTRLILPIFGVVSTAAAGNTNRGTADRAAKMT